MATQHRLVRTSLNTYDGGKYIYDHYMRERDTDNWRLVGEVWAHSIDGAQARIRAEQENSREWTE